MRLVDQVPRKNGVPILKIVELESIAHDEISSFLRSPVLQATEIDIEQFAEEHLRIRFDYAELSNNQSILGMMVFQDCHVPFYDSTNDTINHFEVKAGTALIDKSLLEGTKMQHRARFTAAHECAHWILHRPAKPIQSTADNKQPPANTDSRIVCRTTNSKSLSDTQQKTASEWKEWQADNLASALLMPGASVRAFMRNYLENENKKSNPFIDAFGERMVIAKNTSMLRQMSAVFNVSVSAAEFRLKRLGYLSDYAPTLLPLIPENQQEVYDDWF